MTEPLVTIVITSYNYAHCVGDAISSALGQTYRNLDVLVLDNASTDGSLAAISAFRDERLRVVVHPENIGIQRNHNYGIAEALGEYVVFLSADDMLLPTLVEDALAFLRSNPDIDIPYFSVSVADAAGNVGDYFEHPSFDGADTYRDRNELASLLTRDNCMYMPTMLFPRAFFRDLGELDEGLGILLDYEFDLRLAAHGKRFAFVSKPQAIIRMHGENRSGVKNFVATGKQLREFCTILERYTGPAYHARLAGYRGELMRMLEKKVLEIAGPFAAEFAAQSAELVPLVERTRAALDLVPDASPETLRGEGLISVVVPFSGRTGELDRALRSLRAQDYPHWEAIVVCDGSVDPGGFVRRLGLEDRVRVSRLRRARGVSAARNLGLHGVRGEIVTYLDDDNRYEPGYLGAVARAFADPATEVTAAAWRFAVLGPGGEISASSPFAGGLAADGAVDLASNRLALNAVAHRRSCLPVSGYFNESFSVLEDWEFLIRLARGRRVRELEVAGCTVCVDAPMVRHHLYGRRSSAHWSEYAQRLQDVYNAYPPRTADEGLRREAFSGALQEHVNRGVRAAGLPAEVLVFAQALAGRPANDAS
ncbi:MAG TPA: glycosyltransferase [Candidatus Baltobacteraceae bacterium]